MADKPRDAFVQYVMAWLTPPSGGLADRSGGGGGSPPIALRNFW